MNKNGTKSQRAKRFLEQVYMLGLGQFKVLNIKDYTNAHKKLWIKHLKCGFKWQCEPTNFQSYPHCPRCDKHKKPYKSNKQFLNELYKNRGKKYIPQEKYKGVRTLILFKCNICNNYFKMTPDNILHGNHCPYCAKKSRIRNREISPKEFKYRVFHKYGYKYSILDSALNKIKIRHNCKKCGYSIRWINKWQFLRNYRCVYCNNERYNTFTYGKLVKQLTHGECRLIGKYNGWNKPVYIRNISHGFTKILKEPSSEKEKLLAFPKILIKQKTIMYQIKLKDKFGNQFSLMSKYITSKDDVKIKCNVCGNIIIQKPCEFLRTGFCFKCYKLKQKYNFIKYMKNIDQKYFLLSNYNKASKKVLLKCPHGHLFRITPNDFKNGNRCPICHGSYGEQDIISFLREI